MVRRKVVLDPGRASPRPYGVAIYNSNLIGTLSDIAPQDIELVQLQLADPGDILPGWHVPQGRLPKARLPLFRALAQGISRAVRPAGDFLVLRGESTLYHALVLEEGLDVDPRRRLVSVFGLDFLEAKGEEVEGATRLTDYIRGSRAVFVTTDHLAEVLSGELSIDRERIWVVPGGVDHTRFFPRDEFEVEEVLSRYSLQKPYALAIADSGTARRLVELEAVADRVWKKAKLEIVIVGTSRGRRPGARRIGYVPREHLPALYSGAVAMVSLQPYQGFALAAIESAACGTPVVTIRSPGIRETLGDSAVYVDEGDIGGCADAILALMDRRHRKKIVADGLERARQFTWYRTATGVLEAYRQILIGTEDKRAAGASASERLTSAETQKQAQAPQQAQGPQHAQAPQEAQGLQRDQSVDREVSVEPGGVAGDSTGQGDGLERT
jgi:glycosyltransferase involved in cell wall biosynthesis